MIAEPVSGARGAAGPLAVAVATTGLAALASRFLPEEHAATGVGLWFLLIVYVLVLRSAESSEIRAHGLSLGGVFEPEPIDVRRVLRAASVACGWALAAALVLLPPFWFGYVYWYDPSRSFVPAPAPALGSEVLGQMLGVAFPEEAFFRGYLQSALDRAWPPKVRLLGADLGLGLVVSSAIFAVGHYLTYPEPARLAVFFPSLVFGYLRARTGGVGAPIVFHASCNLFASYLGRSYGLFP